MGNIGLKAIVAFSLIALSSCDLFEVKGFITTYEDVNHRFEQSIAYNALNGTTEISVAEASYTLYVMGDSHVGGVKNLNQFLKDARDEKAAAVIMAGDLTTGNQEDYELFSEQMPPKDSLMYFPIVGNHDLYFEGWDQFHSIFGSSSYFFVVNTPNGSDIFICLDTGGGTLGDAQLEWFKELLELNRENYRYCTVFTHVNLFRLRPTASTNPMVEEMYVLVDLFTRYDVNMVVTGHDHKRNTDILGNTTHIIMDALKDEYDKASYLKLSITEESIDYSFNEL